MINVIFADDHEIFRDGLRAVFRRQSEIKLLAEAADGEELLALVDKHRPDVLLIDIKMPRLDGITATRRILEKYPATGIIALTMANEESLVMDMLDAGAHGYMLKNTSKADVIYAIRRVHSGHTYYCPQASATIAANYRKTRLGQLPETLLNEKEKEILQYLLQGHTNEEIASFIHLSVRTVEGYRRSIIEKTGSRNMFQAIQFAYANGILKTPNNSIEDE